MKKVHFLIAGLSLAFGRALRADELRIPSSVFTMDELEEAKAKSAEQDKPLIFLYTKPSDK